MGYYPQIPEIAKAFENDPRTKMAMQALAAGGGTAPVAQGGYGWADGVARALQGALGGFVQHKQEKAYKQQEQDAMSAAVAALTSNAGGAAAPGGGQGMAPPQQPQLTPPPMVPQPAPDPHAGLPERGGQPLGLPPSQPPAGLPVAPQAAQQAQPSAQIAAALGGAPINQPGPQGVAPHVPFVQAPRLQGAGVVQAMLPITAASESNNHDFTASGSPVTSPKGAKYAMQVMPATARKPGFGVTPARDDSPAEYDRVGRELLGKLTEKYGDPAKAWAAYNAGSRRVDHAIATAARKGGEWLDHVPAETRAYVTKNMAALGGSDNGTELAANDMQPTGPIQYQTPEPASVAMPDRPADRPATQSLHLSAGQRLLAQKNPALFERAMALLDKGMGEQFTADSEALGQANKRDDAAYDAGLGDYTNSRSQSRAAAYETRGREQTEGYAYGREKRGYAHEDQTLASQQGFERGENALNRSATAANVAATIEGKHEDAQAKAQAKMQGFLSTPAGNRMYQESTNRMNGLDYVNNQIDAFMELNTKHPNATGGMVMNMPTGAGDWFARNLNQTTQSLDQITRDIAPRMRQAGQGSMSDRDLQMFERSVPNIKATFKTNQQAAARLKAGIARMNDFELHKLEAAAGGRQVDFLKEWTAYKNAVRFDAKDAVPFDDWKNGNTYGADGKRK